jgi:hypothetical protein
MYKIIVNLIFIALFLILTKTSKTGLVKSNKISKEIIILSFIIILYGLQGMPTWDFEAYYVKFYPAARELIFTRYLVSLTLRIILFVSGVGIIFRKEIFRKIVIGLAYFSLVTIPWKHPVTAVERFILLKINAGVLPVNLLPRIDWVAGAYVTIYSIIDIVTASFLIYLFTRTKIRGQFR